MALWVHTALGVLFCNAAQVGKLALFHALEEASRIAPEMDAQGIVSRPESQTRHWHVHLAVRGVDPRHLRSLYDTTGNTHQGAWRQERQGCDGGDRVVGRVSRLVLDAFQRRFCKGLQEHGGAWWSIPRDATMGVAEGSEAPATRGKKPVTNTGGVARFT